MAQRQGAAAPPDLNPVQALVDALAAARTADATRHNDEDARDTARAVAANRRETIRRLITQTKACEGGTAKSVREWLRELDIAVRVAGGDSGLEVASATSGGALRSAIEAYVTLQATAAPPVLHADMAWAPLQAYISDAFLGAPAQDDLQRELESPPDSYRRCPRLWT